ncbi:hypothetical protein [Nocardioides kribbensis]|uniref:DUF2946 domain-containing protein n=1 Tax=Nocardioides kribbensis TaxID=305517 RepID=A0ABV1NT73_9ACTN
MPAAALPTPAPWWRYALLGALALGLSLMCASYAVPVVSATSTAAMSAMTATSSTLTAADGDQAPSSGLSAMCDAACASEMTTMVCSVIAIAAPLTMLILLVARRRTPFLGLLTRASIQTVHWFMRGRWRGHVPLSPTTLCVWRV